MGIDSFENFNKRQDKEDKKISISLMSSFVILTIQFFIIVYFNLMETSAGSFVQLMSKALVGLVYLYALPSAIKRSLNKFISFYFVAIFVFLLHYAIFSENRPYIVSLIFPFFFMSLPAFIYSMSIKDLKIFKEIMKKTSYIVFYFGLLIAIFIFTGKTSIKAYSMSLSYYMLLPTIMFLDELMDKFSFKRLAFTMLSLLIIISLGSRGALLCGAMFIFFKFIGPTSKRTYKTIMAQFSILSTGLLVLIFMEQILMSFYNFLLNLGINSRTLLLFFRDGIYLSGRDRIYKSVIDQIIENPILGIGIAGDTRIIGISYVHNFFIEVIGNFGIVLGSFLCISLIMLIIKSLFTKDMFKYNLFITWLSLGFVHLMVSSSYLIDIRFWIFLGVMMNFVKRKEPVVLRRY